MIEIAMAAGLALSLGCTIYVVVQRRAVKAEAHAAASPHSQHDTGNAGRSIPDDTGWPNRNQQDWPQRKRQERPIVASAPQRNQQERNVVPSAPLLTCPQCNQIDAVAKVSALVAGGSTSGIINTSGNNATFGLDGSIYLGGTNHTSRASSMTTQARQLSPPVQPRTKTDVGAEVTGAILLSFIPAIIAVVVFPLLFAGLKRDTLEIMVIVYCIALAITLWITFARYKQAKEALNTEIPRWQEAMARWNRLFYCARCDGVFDTTATQRRLIPTPDMMRYLGTGK